MKGKITGISDNNYYVNNYEDTMKRGLFLTGCLSAMLLATVTLASGSEHAQKFNTHAIESENVTFEQFFEAVISGNKDKVKAYLTLGANVHWVDANQRTALHWAILLGHKKVAKKLIKSGAQVDAQDARGYSLFIMQQKVVMIAWLQCLFIIMLVQVKVLMKATRPHTLHITAITLYS